MSETLSYYGQTKGSLTGKYDASKALHISATLPKKSEELYMTLPNWTNSQVIAQLNSGFKWSGTTITYAFPTSKNRYKWN